MGKKKKKSTERFHKQGATRRHFTDGTNVENKNSFKRVLIAYQFEGAKGDDVFSYDFCGIYLYRQSTWEKKLLLLSNDICPSRKRDGKAAGFGRKSLASTNQQQGTGDRIA